MKHNKKDRPQTKQREKSVLIAASVASMIDQFNLPNIRILQDMGYKVHAACNFEKGNTCDAGRIQKLKGILKNSGVRLHQWDCPRSIHSAKSCIRAYRQLEQILWQADVDWIHCHSPAGGALARLAACRAGIPVVYTAHGFHFYHGAPLKNWLLYYPVEKLLSYCTDVLITVNHEDYRFAKRHMHAGQIRRIAGVGIDTKSFGSYKPQMTREEFLEKNGMSKDAEILLSVGELSRRKNHRFVISALPELPESVYYLVCGKGEQQKKLAELAERAGAGGRVRFLGFQEDVREFYKNADVFVFPSRQEGLPAALVEAMASGLPCLVSDIRGNRELVTSAGGRFLPGCRQEFIRKLTVLLNDPKAARRSAKKGQARAAEYDLKIAERKIRKIYEGMG